SCGNASGRVGDPPRRGRDCPPRHESIDHRRPPNSVSEIPMDHAALAKAIVDAWETRDKLNAAAQGPVREAVEATLEALDGGTLRVAEKRGAGTWHVNQWAKKAVLLSFRLNDMTPIPGGPGGAHWWDKVPSKFAGWGDNRFKAAGFRAVPGAIV